MTNEHIEVVKRWQAGEDVSHEALKANAYNAEAAYVAAARADAPAAIALAVASRWLVTYLGRSTKRFR